MLEANSTLSLQYIEEQSRILRDAFTTVEKRQMSKTETFLRHLNDTVMGELKGFRQQYDQLWQSTVIELETHREQYQREIMAISSRLTIVADELVFQKRMAVVQSTLLLLCLALFLFVRAGGGHLELPIVQQVFNKSHNMLRLQFDSPPESPSSKDNSPPRQGRGLRRHPRSRRDLLDGTHDTDAPFSSPSSSPSLPSKRISIKQQSPSSESPPSLGFSPPTPSPTDVGDEADTRLLSGDGPLSPAVSAPPGKRVVPSRGSGGSAIERVRQSQSGPATPRGTRDNPLEWAGERARLDDSGSSSSCDGRSSSISSSSGNEDSEIPSGDHSKMRKTRGGSEADEEDEVHGVEPGDDVELAGARHARRGPGLPSPSSGSGSEDDGTMMLLMD